MPPIFQPEGAARAIFFGAFHPRRQIWLGFPTVKAIIANRLAPDLLDRYLAKSGCTAPFDAMQCTAWAADVSVRDARRRLHRSQPRRGADLNISQRTVENTHSVIMMGPARTFFRH